MPAANRAPLPADARILVIRLSALGDIVFALPVLTALRQFRPQAHISWLVEDRHADLLRGMPNVDQLLVFPRKEWRQAGGKKRMWQHWRSLRDSAPYHCILDLQGNLKSALQTRAVASPWRLGFDRATSKEGAHHCYQQTVAVAARCHRSERDLALVRALGWEGAVPDLTAWPLNPDVVRTVQTQWPASGPRRVLLHHGMTDYGKDKEWLAARWAELARGLAAAQHQVYLLWTPAERERAVNIVQAAAGAAQLAPPTPTLHHLMALLDQTDLVIGTDSGPLHLAAARGQSVVALFGPTDPLRFRPPGARCKVVYPLPIHQPPPTRNRKQRSPLMDQIEVDMVLQPALETLAALNAN